MTDALRAIHQHPQDLTLAIAHANRLPTSRALAHATWQRNSWQLDFTIIGESHHVRLLHNGQFIMDELLACVQITVACTHQHAFSDLRAHHYQGDGYRIRVWFEAAEPQWQPSAHELVYHFPPIDGRAALTRLQWQWTNRQMLWRSLHTYILDQQIICAYSQSHLQLSR